MLTMAEAQLGWMVEDFRASVGSSCFALGLVLSAALFNIGSAVPFSGGE